MKRLTIILLIASLLTIAADWQPWTQMLELPRDLDDLYYRIEAQEYGYVWSECEEVSAPYITWGQIVEIGKANKDTTGKRVILDQKDLQQILVGVRVSGAVNCTEDELFRQLLVETVKATYLSCGDEHGYPILYGSGVQNIIDGVTQ
jgi:hypothetical protein